MNRRTAIIVVAAVIGVTLGAWGMKQFNAEPDAATLGHRPPEYRVRRVPAGDSIGVRSAYLGHVTLVNIWATWCGPCRAEMPSIERLYAAYRDRGFRVAAVSIDEGDDAAVEAFGKSLGLTFDLLHDRSGGIQEAYRTIGVPQTFLVGRDGRVAYLSLGAEDWDSPAMRSRVEQLLTLGD